MSCIAVLEVTHVNGQPHVQLLPETDNQQKQTTGEDTTAKHSMIQERTASATERTTPKKTIKPVKSRKAEGNAEPKPIPEEPTTSSAKPDIPFSRDSSLNPSVSAVSSEDASAVIERFNQRIGDRGIRIKLINGVNELPLAIHENAFEQGFDPSEIRGVLHDGVAYIVRDKHNNTTAIEQTLFHEILAHAGFRQLLGSDIVRQFNKLFLALGGKQAIMDKANQQGVNLQAYWTSWDKAGYSQEYKRFALVDELFAHTAQNQAGASLAKRAVQLAKEYYGAIRNWLRQHGLLKLAHYQDSDIAYLLKQAREAVGKPGKDGTQYLRIPAFSRDTAANDAELWSEVDKTVPKQGVERSKELMGKAWQWAKDNTQEFIKTGGLALVTLRQLAEIGEKAVPAVKTYMTRVERMLTERNKMLDESGKLAERWQKLNKLMKNRLAYIMHQATLNGVDPSLNQLPEPEIAIRVADRLWREKLGLTKLEVGQAAESERLVINKAVERLLRKRRSELFNQAKRSRAKRENFELQQQIAKQADEEWRSAKNALLRHEKNKAMFDKLHQQFMALPTEAKRLFTDARDMYEARFRRKHDALLQMIESSTMANGPKAALGRQLQQEFESAKVQGVYFPLHRQGAYFVRAKRINKELVTKPKVYSKDTKRTKVQELIDRATGEVSYQIEGDSRRYPSQEAALNAASTWATEADAMRSANNRADLLGKRLVAVEQDNGWVLQDDPSEPVFLMYPTAAEAEREAGRLQADDTYSDVSMGKLDKQNTEDELAQASALMQTMKNMQKHGQQAVPDEMYQMMLEMLPDMSMRKNAIHRKGVLGYSEDALNAFAYQMMHQAHQISKLEARDDLSNILEQVQEQVKNAAFSERMLAGNVREELKKRHDWVMKPSNASWTNWTSSFGFVMYLGVSPAAAMVNMSQVPIVGYPSLAAKFGWKNAGNELLKAAKSLNLRETIAGDDALDRSALNNDEVQAMQAWHDMGAIDKTNAQMLAGVGDSDALSNSATYQKWMGKVAYLFHKTEIVNREVMLIAGYRLAKQAGKTHEQAVQIASDITWESQFDYSNANRARAMQGDWAKLLLMFKSYSQHMIYYLLRNANQWGKGGENAKEAKARLLGILGITLALGGVSALPIGLVGAATGFTYAQAKYGTKKAVLGTTGAALGLMALAALVLDEEEDWETETRKALRAMGGDALEALVFRGAVNTITGVDLSGRISLSDLLLRGQDQELDGKDAKGALLEALSGPVIGYGANALYTMPELWSDGHEWRAVEKLAPKFARDIMQTLRYANEGVLNLRGDTVVDSDLLAMPYAKELNAWNLLWKSQGFSAEKMVQQYQKNTDYKNYEKRGEDAKERILRRYYLAHLEGDKEAMQDATQDAKAWNTRYKQAKPIDAKAIQRSLGARLRARRESVGGIRLKAGYEAK